MTGRRGAYIINTDFFEELSDITMLEFDEYKVRLNNLKPQLDELKEALDLGAAERELDLLQAQSAAEGFWDDLERAQKAVTSYTGLLSHCDSWHLTQSIFGEDGWFKLQRNSDKIDEDKAPSLSKS